MVTLSNMRKTMRDLNDYLGAEFACQERRRAMENLGLGGVRVSDMTNRQVFDLLTEQVYQRRAAGLPVLISESDFCALGLMFLSDPDGKPFAKAI